MRWRRLLTDEGGFLNFLVPGAMALFNLLKKPKVQQGLGAAGQMIGSIAGGRAQGKQTDIAAQQAQEAAQQRLFQILSQNAQAQGQFERDSPNVRFGQAMRGNLAANMQDVGVNVPDRLKPYMVNFSGGLRPSAIGAGGRAAGQQLADLAAAQMGKDRLQFPDAPQMQGLPKANWLDKFLGVAGPAASTIGALGPLLGQPTQDIQTPPPMLDDVGKRRNIYGGLFG